ncbi:MAG: DUF2779 domain-containing protein [Cyanobacteria bacterium M5B4]|nr:MAG: DUF2779 domain-containing protein [Cyanobacteria bacterium M5B4]
MPGQFPYLSEFDYKLAHSCLTKLYYKKNNYRMNNTISAYDRCLTDACFMIYALAFYEFKPIAIKCGGDITQGLALTLELLQQPIVTLWEPVLLANAKVARPFILEKKAEEYNLIYISTKGFKPFRNKKNDRIQSEWMSAFASLAFQTLVLEEMLPHALVKCQMLLPDRDFVAPVDNLHHKFRIYAENSKEVLSHFSGIRLELEDGEHLTDFLRLEEVTPEIREIMPQIKEDVDGLVQMLSNGMPKPDVPIDKHCKNCEFKEGFQECWGELAEVKHHIFDFYHGTRLTKGNQTIVRHLIENNKASMFDVPNEALEDNFHGNRQRIQLQYTAQNQEWLSPEIIPFLTNCSYPLHFIDFETARLAVPPLKGLPPYTIVAFQWSCHTITSPGATPQHHSWLSLRPDFPNWEFAQTLSTHLAKEGTVFTWGMHEQTILKEIYRQMQVLSYPDSATSAWLAERLLTPLTDLHALTLKYYFHPLMMGRTSLKRVFPAIWSTNPYLHSIPWLQKYVKMEGGTLQNPYNALDREQFIDREVVIQEGMEAALAYQEIHYGAEQGNPLWGKLLEQYCCLDTIGMVVVWHHWHHLADRLGIN